MPPAINQRCTIPILLALDTRGGELDSLVPRLRHDGQYGVSRGVQSSDGCQVSQNRGGERPPRCPFSVFIDQG